MATLALARVVTDPGTGISKTPIKVVKPLAHVMERLSASEQLAPLMVIKPLAFVISGLSALAPSKPFQYWG
jgi:hypothetical protein